MLLVAAAAAQATAAEDTVSRWRVGLSSTGSFSEVQDSGADARQRFLGTHVFTGSASGLSGGWLTVRTSGRFANLPDPAPYGFEQNRLYSGYLEAKPTGRVKARLGRQLVLGGVGFQSLDGAWMSWRAANRSTVEAWGGARCPMDRAFEAGSFSDDSVYGGRFVWRHGPGLKMALSAARDERGGQVERQRYGFEVSGTPHRGVSGHARIVYDQENEYWDRLQGQLRWLPGWGRSAIMVQAIDRRPFIDPASYFARFDDINRVRVLRAVLRLERDSGYGAEFDAFGSYVDSRSASRLGAALLVPGARVGYSARLGDQGERSRVFGEIARDLTPWLWAACEASFETYAFLSDAPASADRDLTTMSARVRARLRPGVRLTAEIQRLANPDYDNDVRFLCGLDLSRSGINRDADRRWER